MTTTSGTEDMLLNLVSEVMIPVLPISRHEQATGADAVVRTIESSRGEREFGHDVFVRLAALPDKAPDSRYHEDDGL